MLRSILSKIIALLQIALVLSFAVMPLNIMIYYGFHPSANQSPSQFNPLNLSVSAIWILHLLIGVLAGVSLGKKQFWLTGIMGLFCALLTTGISFAYYSWRESLISIEAIIPLVLAILPTMWIYDYLKHK